MASGRGARPAGRPHTTHRIPRDHAQRHTRGHREPAHDKYESCQRAAGAPRARPSGGLRALARALEEGKTVALGGTRAERRRKAYRRAREGDHRIPLDAAVPRGGSVLPRCRSVEDAVQGHAVEDIRQPPAGRGVSARGRRGGVPRGQGRGEARAALRRGALYHFDAATGGRTQALDERTSRV